MEEHVYKLRKILEELEKIKGRHTELVSVYIPSGHNLQEIVNMLRQEYTLTENVKNKTVRNNVLAAIDKILQELRFYNKTPTNGLALFAGNISETESQIDIKVWNIEPPEPLRIKKYWCDQKFELEPLKEMVAERELYGLIVLDNREATIGLLKGKKIDVLRKIDSIVPGKTIKGGQCEIYGTLVSLSDGNILKIEDVKNYSNVKAADFNTFSLTDSPILDIYRTKKTEVFKITTKCPMIELETSKDHFFFVFEDNEITEKPAEKLKIGDTLLMPEKISVEGKTQKLNTDYFFKFKTNEEGRKFLIRRRKELGLSQENLAKKLNVHQSFISTLELGKRPLFSLLKKVSKVLDFDFESFTSEYVKPYNMEKLPGILSEDVAQVVGYFLGDGNYDKNRVCFSESDKELAEHYKNKIEKLFNITPHVKYRVSKKYYEIRICSKVIENYFKGEFIKDKNSLNIMIPEKILKSNNSIVAAFVKGFFDAEGYVSGLVGFGINNKILSKEIQLILLRFGILSSLSEYDNRKNPYSKEYKYTLRIMEKESLKRFLKYIGFSLKRKEFKLKNLINKKSDKSNVRRILISGTRIRNIIENCDMKKQDFPKVSNFFYDERFMSKETFSKSILSKVIDENLLSELKSLLDCQLLPVKIMRIKKYEKLTPMIDLAVKHQNFIANGIFVHNSAQRYERVREGLINDWYKIIAENVRNYFSKFELKGIILGGPGPAKNDFNDGNYLLTDIRKQILGVKNVGYTDEQGLEELVERSQDILAEASIAKEKALLQKFFEELKKETGLVVYGKEKVEKALEMGAVEIILINEGVEEKELTDKAEKYSTTVEVISKDTREGEQLFQLGGIAAILRWKI
jgi:peptide subunit release factor 1 (eRF1)/transcriptional regulator with XRE-family HTH domain